MAENFSLSLDMSDDEAPPEEVRLEESRASALRSRKEALDTTRREKQELKEKRRKRHELFQQQKKRRLLPDDVLEEIGAAPPPQKQPEDAEAQESDEESGDEGVGSEEEVDPSGKTRTLQGGYTVRLVGELSLAAVQQRTAAAFVHDRFYGPGCRRTTNKKQLSLKNKKSKAPSVEFVKKGWAPKHKAKAERMKQRWLHRKQAAAV